jgi:L-2,4-diaminobutyric acid acetyltransferase
LSSGINLSHESKDGKSTEGLAAAGPVSSAVQQAWQHHAPEGFHFRAPRVDDGAGVHALIAACPPLDTNSLYCNLLQCSHFAPWALLAELDTEAPVAGAPARPAGFISAYRVRPDTLFIWQVAVAPEARGRGLASAMLEAISAREAVRPEGLSTIETTITPDNAASWAMFRRLAARLGAGTEELPCFDRDQHFGGSHDSELLLRIGPISSRAAAGLLRTPMH